MPRTKVSTEPITDETDESLVEAAARVFGEDIASIVDVETGELQGAPERAPSTPRMEDFIRVRGGGLYLPVRRRIVWMRGEITPHPGWTIDTVAEDVTKGTFKGGKVEGGYARYRANVFDETGRLIGTGTKTEYSERFMDFVEKAETGAIGRALAVAGFGTEAAIDIDEGLDQERLADAPVSRSISITPSAMPGLRQGGRQESITNAQVAEIASTARRLGLGMALIPVIEDAAGRKMPPLPSGDDKAQSNAISDFLRTLTFEEASQLIRRLHGGISSEDVEKEAP